MQESSRRRHSIRQQMMQEILDSISDSEMQDAGVRQRMKESLHQTADLGDAGDTLSDSGCRRLSIRHADQTGVDSLSDSGCRWSLYQSECRRLSIRQRMQETLYQTADAGDSLSDSQFRRLSIRQRMQESFIDRGCRCLSVRQQVLGDSQSDSECRSLSDSMMQETHYQTADAGDSLSDSGCRCPSIRQRMQETL